MVCLLLTSCASNKTRQLDPTSREFGTEITYEANRDEFWNDYIKALAASDFIVDSIDDESGVIVVSFAAEKPSQYIDCGSVNVQSTHPTEGEETFYFQLADDAAYRFGVGLTNTMWKIRRDTNLTGTANVLIAPRGNQTDLRVNAQYEWSANVFGERTILPPQEFHNAATISFSSGEVSDKVILGRHKFDCRSNGALEQSLLLLVVP